MNINGYEIKPGADLSGANLSGANLRYANLEGADLVGANLDGANVTGTILEKKEVPQEETSLSQRVKELEEELKKYKDKFNQLKALLDV